MFIVIDGPNGSGKTTLIKKLKTQGHKTLSSPNGTPLAKMLRPACRGTEPWTDIDPRIQFLLFSAARLDEYLRLVVNKDLVFADRWWTSTYVYQCKLQGFSTNFLEETVHPDEKIDAVILLDAKNDILVERVLAEREANPDHGVCSWTQEKKTIYALADLYRYDLTEYLYGKNMVYSLIDTSDKNEDEVFQEVMQTVADLQYNEFAMGQESPSK